MLIFVGDTGTPYAEALDRFLARSGLGAQARLLPVVEDTYEWYRAADLLVCASDVESLPRSVLEAMAFGVPVLATEVFGLADLIDDAKTGYLFQPLDLNAAVTALRRVLDVEPAELAAVAEAGRNLVRRDYDSSGYAADVLALLHGLRQDPASFPDDILAGAGRVART
jgi:D-inositol-3-phosphate glycosyltransferase